MGCSPDAWTSDVASLRLYLRRGVGRSYDDAAEDSATS